VDNNFLGSSFFKIQTTEVWTDHFIRIIPDITLSYSLITFWGAGPGLESEWGKYCPGGLSVFDCSSGIVLLNDFESKILFGYNIIKSLMFQVTLRGRSGAFAVYFCKNIREKGAPDGKLYWKVYFKYDAGPADPLDPRSNYANLDFAVDRWDGAGTAFIQVVGPWTSTTPCDSSSYNYSRY
jgi:hypothetical protein